MNTLVIGKIFVELPEVSSTNDYLATLTQGQQMEGTTVFSTHQTAGRGQQGNTWHAAPGQNIACSVLLLPTFLPPSQVFSLNKAVSLAIRKALIQFCPGQLVEIKWPNDILINGKKVCGILIENQISTSKVERCILGFGININQVDFDERHGLASSLAKETGQTFDIKSVLEKVLEQIDIAYMHLRMHKHAQIDFEYLQALYAYQTEHGFVVEGAFRNGTIQGVDAQGRLAVSFQGEMRYFGVKEITFAR